MAKLTKEQLATLRELDDEDREAFLTALGLKPASELSKSVELLQGRMDVVEKREPSKKKEGEKGFNLFDFLFGESR